MTREIIRFPIIPSHPDPAWDRLAAAADHHVVLYQLSRGAHRRWRHASLERDTLAIRHAARIDLVFFRRGPDGAAALVLCGCGGCPLVGPVKGLSGAHVYYGCDALAFVGEKIVEWRAGLPANAWPEPGVWYSAFETDRRRH